MTLNFKNFSPYWFNMQEGFEIQHKKQTEWGLQTMDLDEMKRIFVETNIVLMSVTFVVSLLHSVFEVLAFKNDVEFWNNKDTMEGISVKSLYF